MKNSSVLIVGVGGLGTEIAKNLAMAGVGTIHLVDMDHIEYSNLNRQILFINAEEGEPKAVAAAKMLRRINPYGNYVAHHQPLQELDPAIYEEVDIYIAGLDSVLARQELNRRAVMFQKPLVDGGTITYYGHVYTYIPGKNACLGCDPQREREPEDLAACTLVGRPRRKSHCLLKGQLAFQEEQGRLPNSNDKEEVVFVLKYANNLMQEYFPDESLYNLDDAVKAIDHHDPAIISINSVIASIQTQDALKLIHHLKGTELGPLPMKYTIYNGLVGNFHQFDKPKKISCDVCGTNAPRVFRLKTKKSNTLDMVFAILKKHGFRWDQELDPLVFRMDRLEFEEVTKDQTFDEINANNKEMFLISGIERDDYDKETMYLQLVFE